MAWFLLTIAFMSFYYIGRCNMKNEIIDSIYKDEVDELRRKVDSMR